MINIFSSEILLTGNYIHFVSLVTDLLTKTSSVSNTLTNSPCVPEVSNEHA